ncbi:Rv3235 family protein [Kribbella sp. NPDC058245]|uniref:Rv3235 family protein n=1 Tax=Kribbella sp. NPDC058245 TaxID=3346399 RepID=UPI0036E2020D
MTSAYQEISESIQQQRVRLGVVPAIAVTRPGLPEARAWGGRLAQAVSEVLAGDRPVAQLVRFTDEDVFVELNRRVRLLGLTTTANGRGTHERCALRSVRVCRPSSGVAEIAAHVRHGGRSRAIALRMEVRRNRWVCTALEVG